MSDKASKLEAARKKLREHQERKHGLVQEEILESKLINSSLTYTQSHNYSSNHDNTIILLETNNNLPVNNECNNANKLPLNHESNESSTLKYYPENRSVSERLEKESNFKSQSLNKEICIKKEDELQTYKKKSHDLEIELEVSAQNYTRISNECKVLQSELDSLKTNLQIQINEKNDLLEKLEIITTALTTKQEENISLHSQLEQISNQLDLTQLKLQQLTNGLHLENPIVVHDNVNESNNNDMIVKLEDCIKSLECEKENYNLHYQQFAAQMNQQLEDLMGKNQQLLLVNESLSNRENTLIEQITNMEMQLQSLKASIKEYEQEVSAQEEKNHQNNNEEYDFQKKYCLLKDEYENMEKKLIEGEKRLSYLNETVERLQSEKLDLGKLTADNESDRVAAQRATEQNVKLKIDLDKLNRDFVKMSTDKLELTEKLEAEKFLNRELTLKLSDVEQKYNETRSILTAKDEEMIRLQGACSKLEKEVLLLSQELDRLRHYEAVYNKQYTESLSEAKVSHDLPSGSGEDEKVCGQDIDGDVQSKITKQNNSLICNIHAEDAMLKLQERFTKTIQEVAELADEKQKLEHIIIQLQSETETICEYVALYQQQRGILKQREKDRLAQLEYLASERERMKAQIEFIINFVKKLGIEPSFNKTHKIPEDINKVVNMLSEMKQNHLIEPDKSCDASDMFHPCPWCSGKLIDV